MKNWYFILLITALTTLLSCSTAGTSEDFKVYAWYKWSADVSADSLRHMYADWQGHGVCAVCVLAGDFDLARTDTASRIAHELGLEYHAWVPTMLHDGMDSTWYTVNRLGRSAYNKEDRAYVEYYATLDPHNAQVVEWLVDEYSKVAELPCVDYVQLDYIRYADVVLAEGLWDKYEEIGHVWCDTVDGVRRVYEYPGADYCYCDSCLADFLSQTGVDLKAEMANGVDPATVDAWAQFRCDNITRLVNAISAAVHERGKLVSADVFPGPSSYARWMVRQDWACWDVDMFLPMNYNDFYLQPASWIGSVTDEEVASTERPVMSGLFICQDWQHKASVVDPEMSGLLPSEIEEAVRGAYLAGAKGVCLFRPDFMTAEHWDALQSALYHLSSSANHRAE